MPEVLRVGAFRVAVLFPPREHGPAHVHVTSPTGIVVIELETPKQHQRVRKIEGMSRADVRWAERIVSENTEMLLARWREIWGEA